MAVTPDLVVLRALGLGDLLTGVPALRALAREMPGRRLLLTPQALAPIAEPLGYEVLDLHGVSATFRMPCRPRPRARPSPSTCTAAGPRATPCSPTCSRGDCVAFACGDHDGPAWKEDEHEVARWCRLLASAGIDADPADLAIDAPAAEPPPRTRGATIVHPGAASHARCWPAERWAGVIAAERSAGRRVVITGGADERARARWIATTSGLADADVLAGRTSVSELAAAIAVAGRVVCGDTGVAHLATALGTPSVVLFGPTSPSRWGPPRDRPIHRVLWAGRTGDPHASRPDPGLLAIGEDEVLQALEQLACAQTGDIPDRFPRTLGKAIS